MGMERATLLEASLRVRSSEPRTFSIKGQSSLDEQSNLFIESSPARRFPPSNETSAADHRTTTRIYFFAARVHMEQYESSCVCLCMCVRACVRACALFARNREWERKRSRAREWESKDRLNCKGYTKSRGIPRRWR